MNEKEIKALIYLLDDPDREIFQEIEHKLITCGPEVIPLLEHSWESSFDPLSQGRIENIIHRIQYDQVKNDLQLWKLNNSEDLLEGLLIINRYQYPNLHEEQVYYQLAELRRNAWYHLMYDMSPVEKVKLLNNILFREFGLSGNTSNYHDPQNSFIHKVLETKKGNPISLACIYALVAQKLDIPRWECTEQVLSELTDTVNSQGVVAIVHKPTWPMKTQGVLLVADEIQDPGNMGTLLRTAVGAGVSGLLVVDGSVDLYNPKVLRASMGAIFHLPHWFFSRDAALELLATSGSTLVVADLVDAKDYWDVAYPQNLAVVIGNEARGVHPEFRDRANLRVKIPLIGPVESLNASVAAGVLLYEILRQNGSV